MRKLFHRVISGFSLFWRYFFLLAVVVCLFLAALSFAMDQSAHTLQDTYLEQAEESFYNNCAAFTGDLMRTYNLPDSLEDTPHFTSANMADAPLTSSESLHLFRLSQSLKKQCDLLNLTGEYFLYLRRSQACTTQNRFFRQAAECFDSYLVYQGEESMLALLDRALENHAVTRLTVLLPVQDVSIDGAPAAPYLTLLHQVTHREHMYGFLFSTQSILDYFHMGTLPEDTYLQLIAADGTVLFTHNENDSTKQYTRFSAELTGLSATAVIGIPQSYFHRITQATQTTAHTVFALCLVLGLLMCFVFSHISIRPFRSLIRKHAVDQTAPAAPANEVAVIDAFLQSAREKNAALHSMLLSSVMVRAFSGLPVPAREARTLSAAIPMLQQPLYAAMVRDRVGHAEGQDAMITQLQRRLPEQFLCEYVNMDECILLFRADPAQLELLQCILLDLNVDAEDSPRFVCGVSTSFSGVGELGSAIRQAQFCVPEDGERSLVHFSDESPAPSDRPAFDVNQFQQALACWSQQELLGQIELCAASVSQNNTGHPEEAFYSMLHLLRSAARIGQLSFAAHEAQAYQHTASPAANFRRLKDVVNDLFEQRKAMQITNKQKLQEEIVRYIQDNLADSGLCLFSLEQRFEVSEHFIHTAVVSVTGMKFNQFLVHIRMQEAARLLRETEESINTVAVRCGCPASSTFFRNFKKIYGVSPMEYKKSLG